MTLIRSSDAEEHHERSVDRLTAPERGAASRRYGGRADAAGGYAVGAHAERPKGAALDVEQADDSVDAAEQSPCGQVVAPLPGMNERRHGDGDTASRAERTAAGAEEAGGPHVHDFRMPKWLASSGPTTAA